jgi:GNAT superfamily N-acetyltransferase
MPDSPNDNEAYSFAGPCYIQPGAATHAKALRMLLPGMRERGADFVALESATGRVIGAAAASQAVRPLPPCGPGIAIEVIPPCRRQGIARSLLQHLESATARAGAQALYSAQRVAQESDAAKCWVRLGFTPHETVETQRLPLDQFEPRLAPLLARMQSRIPATAEIIPLYRSNLPAVLQLHLDHLGGSRGDIYRKLRGTGPAAFHPRYSRVLVVGGRVVGCILAHRKDKDTAIVDADIVEPALRGGWANVWLKLEATRGALRLGIKNFEFTSFDHYADTRSFTKKLGGKTVETHVLMIKRLWQ